MSNLVDLSQHTPQVLSLTSTRALPAGELPARAQTFALSQLSPTLQKDIYGLEKAAHTSSQLFKHSSSSRSSVPLSGFSPTSQDELEKAAHTLSSIRAQSALPVSALSTSTRALSSSPLSTTSTKVFSSNSPTIQRDIKELEKAAHILSSIKAQSALSARELPARALLTVPLSGLSPEAQHAKSKRHKPNSSEQAETFTSSSSSSSSLSTKSHKRQKQESAKPKSEYYKHVVDRFNMMHDDTEIINEFMNYDAARKHYERKLRKHEETSKPDAEITTYEKELKMLQIQVQLARDGYSAASIFKNDKRLSDAELKKRTETDVLNSNAFKDLQTFSLQIYENNPEFTPSLRPYKKRQKQESAENNPEFTPSLRPYKKRQNQESAEKPKSEYYKHVVDRFNMMHDDTEIINEFMNYDAARKHYERKLRKHEETSKPDAEITTYEKELKMLQIQVQLARDGYSAASIFKNDKRLSDAELKKRTETDVLNSNAFKDLQTFSLQIYENNPEFTPSLRPYKPRPKTTKSQPKSSSLSQSAVSVPDEDVDSESIGEAIRLSQNQSQDYTCAVCSGNAAGIAENCTCGKFGKSKPGGNYLHIYFNHCY
jgi:hypothetical protein